MEEEKKGVVQSRNQGLSPALPWTTKLIIHFTGFFFDRIFRSNGSLRRGLVNCLDLQVTASPDCCLVPSYDVVVDPSRGLWLRIYLPKAACSEAATGNACLPVVVYFHGGGFILGSPASHLFDGLCRQLARGLPVAVVSVNYRLSPEHRYPAPYNDGVDVLEFLGKARTTASGVPDAVQALLQVADLSRLYLAGDSAGGNIAHHVAHRWCATGGGGGSERLQVAGLLLIQPFFGGKGRVDSELRLAGVPPLNTHRTDSFWRMFLPEGADRDHQAANVFGPRSGGANLVLPGEFPTTVVVIGGFDPLQDWQRKYAEGLKKRGKEVRVIHYSNGVHLFYLFPWLPEQRMLIDHIRSFIYQKKDIK